MTASSMIETKLRGRTGSSAPGDAAAKVLGVSPVDEDEKARSAPSSTGDTGVSVAFAWLDR